MPTLRSAVAIAGAVAAAFVLTGCGDASTDTERASPAPSMAPSSPPETSAATVDRVPADERIVEASGMAVSGQDPSVLLLHNDSGDAANVYRVGPDGEVWGRIRLEGIEARDWEAIARVGTGNDSRVFVGDIGDNNGSWPTISVFEFDEPAGRTDATVSPRTYRFEFEDGPRDAEALMVSPRTGRIYVVSKRVGGAAIYIAPENLSTGSVNVLTRWRAAPMLVTDGAFSPDGARYALRSYTNAEVFDSSTGASTLVAIPIQPQGESLTWADDGEALLVGSEGEQQRIYRVPVPR